MQTQSIQLKDARKQTDYAHIDTYKESNGHSGREEHGKVGQVTEFGFLVLLSEFDVAVAVREP